MTTTSYNIYQQITSVRLASATNILGTYFNGSLNNGVGATLTAISPGALSVDGVLVEVGDRLLLKDQTSTNQNGIYVVKTPGSSGSLWMLERSPDFQSLEQLKVGQYFSVGGGNTFEGSMYVLVEPLPSTIGMGTFNFTNVADGAIPSGPYLLKANNLSDLSNGTTAFENLGLGRPGILVLTDADFAAGGGTYVLTNPPPIYVSMSTTSPGRTLQLPPQDQSTSLQESQNITLLTGNPSDSININNGSGSLIFQVEQDSAWQAIPNDRSTLAGAWEFFGIVQTVDGKTGNVILSSGLNTVYVSNSGSDITGNGSVLSPYATLSHALASITTASPTNQFNISIGGGTYNDTNIVIKPWINIDGNNSTINLSGGISNDTSWYTTNNADAFIQRCIFIAPNGLSAIFNGGNGNIINYTGCDFSQTSTLFTSTNNTSTTGNLLVIQNSNVTDTAPFQGGSIVTDTNLSLIGVGLVNLNINATGAINVNAVVSIQGAELAGTVNVDSSTGTGGFAVLFANAAEVFATVNLIGVNTSYGADAASYYTVPNFSSGATIANVQIFSLADSVAQSTFTPLNYTPTNGGGTNPWVLNSLTANLAGIDSALAGTAIGVYQQLYVNDTFGNDSHSGSIAEPMKTYEAARLKAVSLSPSISNPFVINMIGVFSITGNMTITPYVSVLGTNDYSSIINLTGNVVLDNAWNTTNNPFSLVGRLNIITSGNISLTYTTFRSGSFIRFENCSLQLASVVASGAGTNTACERIIFNNCNTDGISEPTFTVDNVNLSLFNTNPSSDISVSVTSSTSHASFILTGAQTRTGNITLNAAAAGTLTTILGSSNTYGKTLTINGSSNTVNVDSTSYQFTLVLSGGATLSNLVLPTKTDGMINSTYSPVNYTPSAGALFAANTLTGNLKGIDSAIGTGGGIVPSEMIFVDAINGNDSNRGSISNPLKTYEAARLLAVSRNPQYGTGQTIVLMTDISITGNMTISPYVSILGLGKYCTVLGITGNFVLDASWGTTAFPNTQIMNISLIGSNISFTYPSFQNGSLLRFENCSIQLSTPNATVIGSNGSGNNRCETIMFLNCSLDLQLGIAEPKYLITNMNAFFFGTSVSNIITSTVTSTTVHATLIVQDAIDIVGNITVNATAAGTLKTIINGSNTIGSTLTINGTSNTIDVDSSSYQFSSIVFIGGAGLTNLVLPSLTDGLTNSNYTPLNYTPSSGSNFKSNSLTGNLKGIDLAIASVGGGVIPSQLIFLDANTGNDSNTGTMTSPLKTYEAANALAISRSPAYGSGQTIVLMSSVQTVANLVLVPFVDIFGFGMYNSILGVTGSIVLHASWGTVGGGPTCQILNVSFVANNINLVYPAFQDGSLIRFQNCAIQLLDGGAPATITGSNGSGGTGCETVIFDKCNLDISQTIQEPTYNGTNVNMFFWNTNMSSGVTSTITSSTVQATLIIQDSAYLMGDITLNAAAAGTLTTYIGANDTQFTTLTINGTSNTVNIDATSYQFSSIVFSGGATLSNINLPTLTDGLTNGSYSPVNYTPSSGSNFKSTSLTGNLKGIDNSLPKASGSATLVGGTVTVLSASVASGDSIQLTRTASGGVPGFPVVTYNAGVSFTITSTNVLDTSTFKWKNLGA